MNPFRFILADVGFAPHGDTSWVYLTLSLLADRFDAAPWEVNSDPFAALFNTLSPYSGCHCVKQLREKLNSRVPTNVA